MYLTDINIKISLVIGVDKYVEGDLTRHWLNYYWPLIIEVQITKSLAS